MSGVPLGAGGTSLTVNYPRRLQSFYWGRSPSKTGKFTLV